MAGCTFTNAGVAPDGNGKHGMGIGALTDDQITFKRKFRWTFSIQPNCDGFNNAPIPASFVKLAARPNISIEETELNFLNEKTWIPGKAAWETITVTILDAGGKGQQAVNLNRSLFGWLKAVYDFTSTCRFQGSRIKDYGAVATLILYDGCGVGMEKWVLANVWPTAINFGDLDYASSDIAEIELTLRYSDVTYDGKCPGTIFPECCESCPVTVF